MKFKFHCYVFFQVFQQTSIQITISNLHKSSSTKILIVEFNHYQALKTACLVILKYRLFLKQKGSPNRIGKPFLFYKILLICCIKDDLSITPEFRHTISPFLKIISVGTD